MAGRYFLVRVLSLLFTVSLVASQVPTPRPITTTDILTATEDVWPSSLGSVTVTILGTPTTSPFDAAFTLSTTITASGAKATYSDAFYYGLEDKDVSIIPAYNVSLANIEEYPICYFPTSSQWSILPRIVFYMTLVFALLARKHEWLIGGALGAALSYSSLAALQMSFQVWTHSAQAELDLLAMTGILSTSCIIAVPLMNWSSTIQRLGLDDFEAENPEGKHVKEDFKKKQEYGSTRIVLVFWNIIVAIGFLAAFAGLLAFLQYAPWIDFTIALSDNTITCAPTSGILDASAGQLPEWDSFWLTSEFVDQNNCIDPCGTSSFAGTLFRSPSELQLFSMGDINHFFEQTHISRNTQRNIHFVAAYYDYLLFLLPFIILQGVMQMLLFWRSSPQKARWQIYRRLLEMRKIKLGTEKRTAYTRFAFCLAITFYGFAVIVLLIAPAAFILSIVATELALAWTPQSETNAHVDQWGAFAILILVLLAALITRVAPGARRSIKVAQLETKYSYYTHQIRRLTDVNYKPIHPEPQLYRLSWLDRIIIIWRRMYEVSSYNNSEYLESARYHAHDFWLLLRYEWHLTREFWREPSKKPQRREKDTSGRWKRPPPHSYKNDELREQIRWIKQRKGEVREAKKQFKELELRDTREKLPNAPFPSTASSFNQSNRDVEAVLIMNDHGPDNRPNQDYNINSDSTPLLSTNASQRRRGSSGASSQSAAEARSRSVSLQEPQEPSQVHVAGQSGRSAHQHSWRSTNESAPELTRTKTYETQGISPASTSMSLYNNQYPNTSNIQVSEINSLRRQRTSASSRRADRNQENIPVASTTHVNNPYINTSHVNTRYNDTPRASHPNTDKSLPNTPHTNNSTITSRHQSLEQLDRNETISEMHQDYNPETEQDPSRRPSTSRSLQSSLYSYPYTDRSGSPDPIMNPRISIVHELPPIDIDSSFAFNFDAGR